MEMKLDKQLQQLIHIFDSNDPDDQKILEKEREVNASREKPEKCKRCCYSHEFGCLNEYCVND